MITKRDWLAEQGLAKKGARGRFSREAIAAIVKAESEGMKFDEPVIPTPVKSKSVQRRVAVQKEAPVTQEKSTADPAAVRKWAKENGVTVSERGRVSEETKLAYEKAMEAQGGEVIQSTPGARGEKDTRQHSPLLVSEDTVYVGMDDKPVKGITYKSACANSGVSIGYCGEPVHQVVTQDMTAGLVEVRPL